jgi:hypothetical protein
MPDIKVTLPFDPARQSAIVGHAALNPIFAMSCHHKIDADWFNDLRLAKLWQIAQKFYQEFHRVPSPAEWEGARWLQVEDAPERRMLMTVLKEAQIKAGEIGLDVLQKEMTEWMRARLYREAVEETTKIYNNGDTEKAVSSMIEKSQELRNTSFYDDVAMSFDNPLEMLERSKGSYENALTFGLSAMDAALDYDGQPRPSLYRGDSTLLLAPSGAGKTSTMVTVASHNVAKGRHILLVTLEGRPQDIWEKIMCSFLNIDKKGLFALPGTPEGLKQLTMGAKLLSERLTFLPYNKAGSTVEDVTGTLRRRCDEWESKHHGRGYDMVVCDYPALLTTERASRGNLAKRNVDEIVYGYFVQFALEKNLHMFYAIQTNRSGSKANKEGKRVLDTEDVAESWPAICVSTNVITINRDVSAMEANRVSFGVVKSRSNSTGTVIAARSDYKRCVTHSEKLGATSYKGDSLLGAQAEKFIEARQKEISATEVREMSPVSD